MRSHYFVFALLSALSATAAQAAGGVCLRWNKCYSETGAAINRSFACDTDAGSQLLVGSFYSPVPLSDVTQVDAVIDMASSSTSLPPWWQFTACRAGSMTVDATAASSNLTCEDWGAGLASAATPIALMNMRGPNTARITLSTFVPGASAQALTAFLGYFTFNVSIDHLNTVGGAACGGCATPVCIVLNTVSIAHGGAGSPLLLTAPANNVDSHYVTWQGGGAPVVGTVTGCPAATPTRSSTWSAVKNLYR